MTLALTPATLEAAYEYLRTTLPFRRWKLPHADKVEFFITNNKRDMGRHWRFGDGSNRIEISTVWCRCTKALLETMAHEMIHLRQALSPAKRSKVHGYGHGNGFKRMAAQVCRCHGFDLKTF